MPRSSHRQHRIDSLLHGGGLGQAGRRCQALDFLNDLWVSDLDWHNDLVMVKSP